MHGNDAYGEPYLHSSVEPARHARLAALEMAATMVHNIAPVVPVQPSAAVRELVSYDDL